MNLSNKAEPLTPEYEQKKNLAKSYEQECKTMSEINARLQKQVAERAAGFIPESPLDELRRLREQAKLAMPEIMEFIDRALEHSEQLSDDVERLERELEEARGVWASSADKMPEPYTDVLAVRIGGRRLIAYHVDGQWHSMFGERFGVPLFWMPLPEAPDVRR
jgi:hypothetical protein